MKEQNGIQIYDPGEKPQLPEGLEANFQIISPFGFKVVDLNGKKVWQTASEEDYRDCEAQRLGIAAEDVLIDPLRRQGKGCFMLSPTTCDGNCAPILPWNPSPSCRLSVNNQTGVFYCACA